VHECVRLRVLLVEDEAAAAWRTTDWTAMLAGAALSPGPVLLVLAARFCQRSRQA
jgi:hypothetical protein